MVQKGNEENRGKEKQDEEEKKRKDDEDKMFLRFVES